MIIFIKIEKSDHKIVWHFSENKLKIYYLWMDTSYNLCQQPL